MSKAFWSATASCLGSGPCVQRVRPALPTHAGHAPLCGSSSARRTATPSPRRAPPQSVTACHSNTARAPQTRAINALSIVVCCPRLSLRSNAKRQHSHAAWRLRALLGPFLDLACNHLVILDLTNVFLRVAVVAFARPTAKGAHRHLQRAAGRAKLPVMAAFPCTKDSARADEQLELLQSEQSPPANVEARPRA